MESHLTKPQHRNSKTAHQPDKLEDALLLLSRLFGRQSALDFLKDADMMNEGGSE
jgi:hypothetical protein